MLRPVVILLLLALPLAVQANEKRLNQADFPQQLKIEEQQLVLRNAAVLNYLFVDVYSAALLAPPTAALNDLVSSEAPLHLELFYYRNIGRDDVIKAAWVTLERQYDSAELEQLRPGIDALHATFTDISPGDRYGLTLDSERNLSLQYNGEEIFQSDDEQLARAYVGIWLRENGLSERLRRQLIAER